VTSATRRGRAKLVGVAALSCFVLVLPAAQALAQRSAGVTNPSYCPAKSKWTKGVYHPARLVLQGIVCQRAVGAVRSVKKEEDGDLHIGVKLIAEYKALINDANVKQQHAWLVVEFMARDAGHLPKPKVGDKVTLVGAWILDTQHGWMELHPVWRMILDDTTYTSGPQFGGSPTGDKSKNAAEDCRDEHGLHCIGY
jgi:hypothetical protein